ncbi:dehydrogenase/reductase SDR family member 11-like [Dysidea avara]|uniref:dehydrogenase/reductase SDR family member 11-like n=1 Tax=Dysidea avara TaxID=196820 RepID=UPI003330FA37
MMEQWKRKVAIVTGASSGIGREVAKQLALNGMIVIGCARNQGRLEELSQEVTGASGKVVAMKCDVRKEEDILSMFDNIKTQFGGADVCINNAGLMRPSPLLSGSTEEWREQLEINVLGACVMTREFVTRLKERHCDTGHIIMINSIFGHMVPVGSTAHMYSVTKFALKAITEGIRQELRVMDSGIKITEISPGHVYTEIAERAFKCDKDTAKAIFDQIAPEALYPEDIASTVLHVLSSPPRVQVHEMKVIPVTAIRY